MAFACGIWARRHSACSPAAASAAGSSPFGCRRRGRIAHALTGLFYGGGTPVWRGWSAATIICTAVRQCHGHVLRAQCHGPLRVSRRAACGPDIDQHGISAYSACASSGKHPPAVPTDPRPACCRVRMAGSHRNREGSDAGYRVCIQRPCGTRVSGPSKGRKPPPIRSQSTDYGWRCPRERQNAASMPLAVYGSLDKPHLTLEDVGGCVAEGAR